MAENLMISFKNKNSRLRLVSLLSLVVVFALIASVVGSSVAPVGENQIEVGNPNASFPVAPVVSNPGIDPTSCQTNAGSGNQSAPIIATILLDRSSSVAPSDVPAYKQAVKNFLTAIAFRAAQEGTEAYANIYAFATYSVWQNSLSWLTINQGFRNLADPTPGPFGLNALALHHALVDDIFFSQNRNNTYAGPSTAYRGYRPAIGTTTLYSLATNWHDAFSTASASIRFWQGQTQNNNRNLVVMFTDGVPTVNNDRNHVADNASTLSTTQTASNWPDFLSARYGVNRLRTGVAYRDQNNNVPVVHPNLYHLGNRTRVNVYGVLVTPGTDINGVNSNTVMNSVFGTEGVSWWRSNNYNNAILNSITTGILDQAKCDDVQPITYDPGVEIVNISTDPPNRIVREGNTGSLSVTVRNTTTFSGPAGSTPPQPMRITLEIGGADYNFNLSHGSQGTRTHTFNISLGQIGNAGTNQQNFNVRATGTFNLGSPYELASNADNIVTDSESVEFTIERIPLPS